MPPTVPLGLPGRLRAGDTWLFTLTYGEYPAGEGWTPKVFVAGPSVLAWSPGYAVTAGDGWTVTIPATATVDLPAGTYEIAVTLAGSGTYAGREHTVEWGALIVDPDLETAAAGDRTAWEETAVTTLRAAIAELTTGKVKAYAIGNRQVTYHDLPELLAALGRIEARLATKRNPGGLGQRVAYRFPTVSR